MQDIFPVLRTITPLLQQNPHPLQIGDRFQIVRTLLLSKRPIQIGSDPDMLRISRDLANMIEMIEHCMIDH